MVLEMKAEMENGFGHSLCDSVSWLSWEIWIWGFFGRLSESSTWRAAREVCNDEMTALMTGNQWRKLMDGFSRRGLSREAIKLA